MYAIKRKWNRQIWSETRQAEGGKDGGVRNIEGGRGIWRGGREAGKAGGLEEECKALLGRKAKIEMERGRLRQTDRHTEIHTQRQTDIHRQRHRQRDRETAIERETEGRKRKITEN